MGNGRPGMLGSKRGKPLSLNSVALFIGGVHMTLAITRP